MKEILEYSLSSPDDFYFEIHLNDKNASRCDQIIIQCENALKVNSIYHFDIQELFDILKQNHLEVVQSCFEEMLILFENKISILLDASEVALLSQDGYDELKGRVDVEILCMLDIGLLHITRNISLPQWQSDATLTEICDSARQLSKLMDQIVKGVKVRFQ